MKVSWNIFKSFVDDRSLSVQWVDLGNVYWLKALDGSFSLECELFKSPSDSTDLDDFEANYKPKGNRRLQDRGTLKLVKFKASTVNGVATILFKIPGNNLEDTRIINGGIGWFTTPHDDDFVEIYMTDEENLLGYGAGFVVDGYTDTEVNVANRGWYLPKSAPILKINALAGLGILKGGLYLKIIATKGDLSSDTFRGNVEYGSID